MFDVQSITKRYGPQSVLDGVSWPIRKGCRTGLIGPNGAGKTTLLRILTGVEAPDAGEIALPKHAIVGYLPQEVETLAGGTVLGHVLSGFFEVGAIEEEIERIENALASRPAPDELAALTARYGDLRHRYEALGGYRLEGEARAILGGLGFPAGAFHAPLETLSGGWRMRAALAGHLLRRPDLLLLDEPTNHLDLDSLAWLEEFLDGYGGSLVIVSHDRFFLNRVVEEIAELEGGRLTLYSGDYDDYVEEKQARLEGLVAAQKQQQREIAQAERFIERFRYKATKARQVQSRIKRLAKVGRIRIRRAPKTIRFSFPQPARSGAETIRLEGIRKAYGENVVYAGVDFVARRGERIALVGPNGAGKSTLLKILAGRLEADAGARRLGHNVTLHYYAQHQLEALAGGRTVLEEIESVAPDDLRPRLRSLLGTFLFHGDDVEKKVGVLSGGEKARLALARMLVRPASLLLLDEPTNHLDLRARGVLEEALDQYTGTMVLISHDRYFINRIATSVCEVRQGRLDHRPGAYDDYLDRVRAREKDEAAVQGDGSGEAGGVPERGAAGRAPRKGGASSEAGAAQGSTAARPGRGGSPGGAPEHGETSRWAKPAQASSNDARRSRKAPSRVMSEPPTARGRSPDRSESRHAASTRTEGDESTTAAEAVSERPSQAGRKSREQKRLEAQERQKRHLATKGFRERLGAVEREIAALEARLREVESALADPALYKDGDRARDIGREHRDIQERIAWLYDEWSALEETLNGF